MLKLFLELKSKLFKDSLDKNNYEKLKPFIQKKIAKEIGGYLELNSQYKLAIIEYGKVHTFAKIINEPIERKYIVDDLDNAQEGDIVLIQRLFGFNTQQKAKIITVLESSLTYGIAILNDKFELIDIKTQKKYKIEDKFKNSIKPMDIVQINLRQNKIDTILGNLYDKNIDQIMVLKLFLKHTIFSPQIEEEVKQFSNTINKTDYPNRKDLTNLAFVTIDPDSAKDYDDAIYYDSKNSLLYVAIADVSYYVKEDSQLDKEAFYRAFTLYFPHQSVPMLPRMLSENLCSLMPNQNRLAMVCEIKLNNLEVESTKFYEAIIHSQKRFTYSEVDLFLDNIKPYPDEFIFLKDLYQLTQKLRINRLENGFDFSHQEVITVLNDKFELELTKLSEDTSSHQLVEECMLLANKAAANTLPKKAIFRTHDEPNYQKIETLYQDISSFGLLVQRMSDPKEVIKTIQEIATNHPLNNEINELLIKAQMKAKYSDENLGHFGLGFDSYTHFTSPIRRYSDLIVHRLLKNQTLKEPLSWIAHHISTTEIQNNNLMQLYNQRIYAKWANKNFNTPLKAKIIQLQPEVLAIFSYPVFGGKIILDTLPNDYKLFDEVDIELIDVDLVVSVIKGKIIE